MYGQREPGANDRTSNRPNADHAQLDGRGILGSGQAHLFAMIAAARNARKSFVHLIAVQTTSVSAAAFCCYWSVSANAVTSAGDRWVHTATASFQPGTWSICTVFRVTATGQRWACNRPVVNGDLRDERILKFWTVAQRRV